MKLGVFNPVLYNLSLEEALKYIKSLGLEAMEVGVGGYPGTTHVNAKEIIKDPNEVKKFKALFEKYNIEISAISVHGNPIHPDKEVAKGFEDDYQAACILAQMIGVDRIVTFSGCPGDSEGSKRPNWVTCPWPSDFEEILKYQWDEVLIPYWKKAAQFASNHGIKYICLEMHPGFCVYNPATLLRLRKAVGEIIGANFDPSHLIWQQIDPAMAIKELRGAIYHFHAKDTSIDKFNCAINGVLDIQPYGQEYARSWVFRTIGYGTDFKMWKDIFSALNLIGYTHVISIEHEDSYMSATEGLEKAVEFLKMAIIKDKKPGSIWWA